MAGHEKDWFEKDTSPSDERSEYDPESIMHYL